MELYKREGVYVTEDFFKTFENRYTSVVKIEFGQHLLEINLNKIFLIDYGDWHSHPLFELQYVLNGVCRMKIENQQIVLETGQFILMKPNTYHATILDNDNALKKFSLSFRILPNTRKSNIQNNREEEKAFEILLNDSNHVIDRSEEMREWILQIFNELQQPKIFSYYSLRSNLTCIMLTILRKIYNRSKGEKKHSPASMDEKRCALIDYYFNENFHRPEANSKELASYLKISERQLNRILNNLYKCSFNKKLNYIRIQKAMYSLRNSSYTIEEISERVGFFSINYFYKIFREHTGTTPAKYRKMG